MKFPSHLWWSFNTWWDTNYIAYVQKQNKQKRTPISQTWPKRLDTAWHNLPKSVWRIRSSWAWVRSNPTASKPRSLATPLSLPCECRKWTSSLSIVESKVGPYLLVPSKACKVSIFVVATLKASSFSANSIWRWKKANYSSLGSLPSHPYSMLKVEWM